MASDSILVLGANGMLGQAVYAHFLNRGWKVVGTQFTNRDAPWYLDAAADSGSWRRIFDASQCAYAINCIGKLGPAIRECDAASLQTAIRVNSLFPHLLAQSAAGRGVRVIHISTDGVFKSGGDRFYFETDPADCTDHYGRSKALGECPARNVINIRCSVVGYDSIRHKGLLEWLLGQPDGSEVAGFADQLWNGVTALQFGQLCEGLVADEAFDSVRSVSAVHHFCPNPVTSKYQLLCDWLRVTGKRLTMVPTYGHSGQSRRLASAFNCLSALVPPSAKWLDILDELVRSRSK